MKISHKFHTIPGSHLVAVLVVRKERQRGAEYVGGVVVHEMECLTSEETF